jgi:Family of unknown function (DUF6455)
MGPTLSEIGIAAVMLVAAATLFAAFAGYFSASSENRMLRMLAGTDARLLTRDDAEASIEDARLRCRKCRAEDLCERWLAGKVAGDNSFCPNARIFRALARTERALH